MHGAGSIGIADEDDIAQSAFASFYRAAEQGRFPQLSDRHDLWRLLIVITQRKIAHRLRHQKRKRRTSNICPRTGSVEPVDLDDIAGSDPTPEFCMLTMESFRELLNRLDDSTLQSLALKKMEGYTNEEIARERDCSLSTIERKLRRIRHVWATALGTPKERANE
jgi:DNA-directed RNA polymerase specialized sigma24 family protein